LTFRRIEATMQERGTLITSTIKKRTSYGKGGERAALEGDLPDSTEKAIRKWPSPKLKEAVKKEEKD